MVELTIHQSLALAKQYHRRGSLKQAELLYGFIL